MKKILTTFVSLLLIAVATRGTAMAQEPQTSQTTQTPKYTVNFAGGTDDTASWTFDPATAKTTGVEAGSSVTLTYTGSLRVKSITAKMVDPIASPLTFEAKIAGTQVALVTHDYDPGNDNPIRYAPAVNLEYSTDGTNWTSYTVGNSITLAHVGDMVQFRATSDGNATLGNVANSAYNYFTITGGSCFAYGNVMSLLYQDFDEATTFPTGSSSNFFFLFLNCDSLYNHRSIDLVLPATTLTPGCYQSMFRHCSRLTKAPTLSAQVMANRCYQNMFSGCESLTVAPELPATTLADSCYGRMFQRCTGLTAAPELPATTLYTSCYNRMFWNCTGLTEAPELPATTLADSCYRSMFQGCVALSEAPVLSAATLTPSCYRGMFQGCSSLNSIECWAADITATNCLTEWVSGVATSGNLYHYPADEWTIGVNGIPSGWTTHDLTYTTPLTFQAMVDEASVNITNSGLQYRTFSTSTSAWSDWASYTSGTNTTMAAAGDKVQFRAASNQNSMNNSRVTLSGNCYVYGNVMSLLYTADEFPTATSFASGSSNNFGGLFNVCTDLYNHPTVKLVLPATTLTDGCYNSMFYECTNLTAAPVLPATTLANGCYGNMFNGCSNLRYIKCLATDITADNCLYNWVSSVATSGDFYYYSSSSWSTGDNGIPTGWTAHDLAMYAAPLTFEAVSGSMQVALTAQGTNAPAVNLECSTDGTTWTSYTMGAGIDLTNAGDKVMFRATSDATHTTLATSDDNYHKFTLSSNCYVYGNVMSLLSQDFTGSENLSCYGGSTFRKLFDGCANLYNHTSKELLLPATTLADSCYYGMFYDCTHLTAAPALPATKLADHCYHDMFRNCSSLTAAPALPAVRLAPDCYYSMFYGCTDLTATPALPATTLTRCCYRGMFYGCTSLTAASELPATTLASHCYRSMFYGCTSLTTAPVLPATTLVEHCYRSMFERCTQLSYIKCMATSGINIDNSTTSWVKSITANPKTFVRNAASQISSNGSDDTWPISASGIPNTWTVQTATE